MLRFVIRRLLIAIPLVIAASFVVFLLVINAGKPAAVERLQSNPTHSPAALAKLESDLGLHDSWYVRYGHWASGAKRYSVLSASRISWGLRRSAAT